MLTKVLLGFVWLALIIYGFFFAPSIQPDTFKLIIKMSLGQWDGINPLIISIFYLMGILPIIYACFLVFDDRGQKIAASPFVIASFGFGAFALLPYLILRQPNPKWDGDKNWLLNLLDSPWLAISLTFSTTIILCWGIFAGDWTDFVAQFQTSLFIHVMSLDFCLLCLLFPVILPDDMQRRGITGNQYLWLATLFPLLGTLIYLSLRPSLDQDSTK